MSLEPWHSKPTKGKSRSGGLSSAELLIIVTNSAKRHARRRRTQPRPGA